jgi:hypothetical protein
MHARVTRFDAPVDSLEKLSVYFADTVVPAYAKLPGYKGALTFSDPAAGKWQSITLWESEATVRASEQVAVKLRQTAKTDFKLGSMTVEIYAVDFDSVTVGAPKPSAPKPGARGAEAPRH